MPLLEARHLSKTFSSGQTMFGTGTSGQVRAVNDVSLTIEAGETLGLVGESGSGKSTLGRMVLRLIEPDSGEVLFDGHDVLRAGGARIAPLAPRHADHLPGPIRLARSPHDGRADCVRAMAIHGTESRAERRQRAAEVMRAVGMDGSALQRYPHEFSGGQRQRVGIARALVLRPRFIVADEPVSALDVSVGSQIVNLLKQLQRDFSLTYLFISHSMPIVRYLANRIAVMQRGELVEVGDTEQITTAPQHPYTRSLLAATPEIEFSSR